MYLLDTNIVSEARRRNPVVVDWLRSTSSSILYLSVMTLGEVRKGIALKERSDQQAAGHLAGWLQKLRDDFEDRILPITDHVALEWGRISALRPRGDIDGQIAATAIVHRLTLVTRNVADFEDINVSIVNPWELGLH